jgi:hypothetical protein
MKIFMPPPPQPKPTDDRDIDLFREAASRAGRTLAIQRRVTRQGADLRTWTGVVFNGKRSWVGQQVILPNGTTGWIKKAQANYVCVRTAVSDPVDGPIHEYLEPTALRPYKSPEAVLLGSRKRGKREKPSAAKAAASRRNGAMPVRPGSRPRGRPRKRKELPRF